MKPIYLTLIVFGLITGGLFISGIIPNFSPVLIYYIPSTINQLTNPQGNGVLCFEYCGPCSSWGEDYLPFEDGCRLPESVDDCNSVYPRAEWNFINNKCIQKNLLTGSQEYNLNDTNYPDEIEE